MTMWLVAALAILVGSILQRLSGTGVGLVCAPVLALLLGSAQGVLVTNATATISGFLIMLSVRRNVEWRKAALIVAAALPGIIAGALIVRAVSAAALQVIIGAVVLFGIAITVFVPQLPHVEGTLPLLGAGAVGGLFNSTAGVAAPAMVIYARFSRWEQRTFAATMQPVFMSMGALSVALKTALSATHGDIPPWWFALVVIATVLLGIAVGGFLAERTAPHHARALALVLAGLGGAITLGRGLLALLAR